MNEKEVKRKKAAMSARERRRRNRRRVVLAERITVALLIVVVIVGGTTIVWNLMPGVKVAKQLEAADAFVEIRSFDEAIASCEEALKIDSNSVEAYRAMAGVYNTKEDRESAEQTLYRGWETTQDESLLQEYCVYLLNDAVADINSQNCSFATLDKCLKTLEKDPANTDVYTLLDACYERMFASDDAELFMQTDENGVSGFENYVSVMDRMLAVYGQASSEALKAQILQFALPQNAVLWMQVSDAEEYLSLLERVAAVEENEEISQLMACLGKAVWAQETFAQAFVILESGEFEPIKEFMQSEEYVTLRDQFICDEVEYWDGKTYIPVSREKMKLMRENGEWKFAFADFDECPDTAGVINIWGAKQEDAGVQRICLSFEPAAENEDYYPHTTYEFVYLYSNVKINGEFVPQMNYRFETRTATQEGTTSEVIGDWGGEHEWTMEY